MESHPSTKVCITPTPWRSGNRFVLLPDGDRFFPRIIEAIETAHSTIEIEMYLVASGQVANRFIEVLSRAAARQVRVRFLLDHVGSLELNQQDRHKLRKSGVAIRFYNRLRRDKKFINLARDHRKIIVIDDQYAFVGGTGITDEFDPETSHQHAWRELMIEIQGPVVGDWKRLFEHVWSTFKSPYSIQNWRIKIQQYRLSFFDKTQFSPSTPHARINGSRGFGSVPIKGALISQLRNANKRAWISTAYFYPSRKLRREIKKAAMRGVDVRLLLPGPKTDHPSVRFAGQALYSKLLENNVRIFEYQPRFLHMKVALVDNWCSIGSCNFDRWNLRWNLEANQEIIDKEFSDKVEEMMLQDFTHCQCIDEISWSSRSWLQKFRELFWSTIGGAISKLFFH